MKSTRVSNPKWLLKSSSMRKSARSSVARLVMVAVFMLVSVVMLASRVNPMRAVTARVDLQASGAENLAAQQKQPASPTTIYTVDNLGDAGAGSGTTGDLRYCITQAISLAGSHTINFSVTGTINLLSALPNLSASALTISGPGASLLTIRRDSSVTTLRIFQITSNGTITISGLTLANGNAGGGGAVFKFFGGTLNMDNCVLANNAGGTGGGGAISNVGTGPINLTNSTFSGNSASGGEGGVIRHQTAGTISITGCTFSGNTATNLACLHNNSSGTINITNSLITGNSATFDAGAISNSAGSVTVTGCTISNNHGGNAGGAIVNQTTGTVTVTDSTISGNSSGSVGGGIYNNTGTINVTRSTLSANSGTGGGGIYNNTTGTINLTNATISGNSASSSGGGLHFSQAGGQGNIISSTITGNNASSGGGINVGNAGIVVTIKNTIISGNTASNTAKDISGPLTSGGYNLIGNNTGGTITPTTGDQIGTSGSPINPLLGPLQDNGGPTFTRALLTGSPAIDAGNAFGLTTDQRGFSRPYDVTGVANVGDASDIGAYEAQTTLGLYPATTVMSGTSATVTPNFAPASICTINSLNATAPGFSGSISVDPSTGVVLITAAAPVGTFTVTVSASDNCGGSAATTFTLNVTNTLTWNGSASNNWNNAANWSPGFVPAAPNDVVFPASGVTNEASLSAATAMVNNLTIASGRILALSGQNLAVNGTLSLNGGLIDAGANTLTLGPAATITRTGGQVVGNLRKQFGGVGSVIYPVGTANGYSPVEVAVTAGAGELTIKAVQGAQPVVDASQSLQRYWSLNGTGVTVNLVFHYLEPDDLPVGGSDAGYRLIRVSDGTAVIFANDCAGGSPCVNAAANTATINGVTTFSDWTAGAPSQPTAVRLEGMQASRYDSGTLIEWQTGYEVNNLGFRLYRDDGGKRTLINPQMLAGSALLAGANTVLGAGRSYAWWDDKTQESSGRSINQSIAYWLEDIDLNGQSAWHGPCFARQAGDRPRPHSNADVLSQLGNRSSSLGSTRLPERAALPGRLASAQASFSSPLAAQPAVKISVRREGWYSASAPDLYAAGLDPRADPQHLQLYVDGQPLPLQVSTDTQGRLTAIAFYGRGLDAAYTDTRVYWLIAGTQLGLRIPQVNEGGNPTAARSFITTVERKDRTVYFSALRNGERENFFGAVVAGNAVEQTINLQHIDQTASGQAELAVALQGVSLQTHRVWAYINGAFAGELSFYGQSAGAATFAVAHALLKEGDNQVQLVSQGGASDVSLVDYLRLSFYHRFTADANALRLTVTGKQAVSIDGFSHSTIRVFDVTNPEAVSQLSGKIEQQQSGYAITVAASETGERQLLAIADEQAASPAHMAANQPSNLRTTAHAADLVIITTQDLRSAFEPLRLARAQQGIKTEIVDVEDIYDEFSYGSKSPQAVKDFLSYAAGNWKTKPRYVLLAGDGSYDAKNYLGFGDMDMVPTKLIDTSLMEAASDEWLADFNGDGVAELAMGRLPVRSASEATAMVAKLIAYDKAAPAESLLLVADQNEGFDFEGASQQLSGLVPSNLRVESLNRGQLDAAEARRQLLAAIERGAKLINYSGHGSVNLWRGNLLTSADAQEMSNRELPVFVMMTCLNGYFDDPALDSLGEALLKSEKGGAVAVWASSGMTLPFEQSLLNQELYRLLFSQSAKPLTMGEATARARSAVSDPDIRRTWVLLGDPTTRLR